MPVHPQHPRPACANPFVRHDLATNHAGADDRSRLFGHGRHEARARTCNLYSSLIKRHCGRGSNVCRSPESGSERVNAVIVTGRRSRYLPWLLVLLIVLAAATTMLGLRTYRSFTLLSSAYELGVPEVSTVRPWMTLDYVATAYHPAARNSHPGFRVDACPATSLRHRTCSLGREPATAAIGDCHQ